MWFHHLILALSLMGLLWLLTSCTTATGPLLLYADAKEIHGRMAVQTEILCSRITQQNQRYCSEAARTEQVIQSVEPGIRAELAKSKPDWAMILQYVQIIIGIASKFAILPPSLGPAHQGVIAPTLPGPLPAPLLPLTPAPGPQGQVLDPPTIGMVTDTSLAPVRRHVSIRVRELLDPHSYRWNPAILWDAPDLREAWPTQP
jgi:hypothetical protein